jgi:isopentenyl diphosphate isomerase/L-lactate dehydrogenase-like FMN-dependent dehydrogenase
MHEPHTALRNRRAFLGFLAASPLAFGQGEQGAPATPEQALNVLDFEAAARRVLPPAHFGYLATGVDDDATLKANREAFRRLYLRPRRLVDISRVDLRTELFGEVWETPIALAPVGNQKAFHAEGELAVARAARAKQALAILSTFGNTGVEDMAETLGRPPWYQLYTTSRWDITERLVRRAERAGCPVLVLTIDSQAGRHTETFERWKRADKRNCAACHGIKPEDFYRRKPMLRGIDVTGISVTNPAMNWGHVRRLKQLTAMKLLLKGVETREDAALCVEHGVDGIIVSNHGGRSEESGRGTLDCLPEVVEAAGKRMPVLVDGGFRRGTDIFKALALGARAVCLGRPYIWGLAAFGQAGVERVLDILRAELELVMKQCGATSVAAIGPASIGRF